LHLLLVVLAAAAPVLYEARVATFGCNSTAEVANLLKIRAEQKNFQNALYEQIFAGQCVPIDAGSVVEGTIDNSDPTVLRVGQKIDPPGYMAPLNDFRPKSADKTAPPKESAPAAAPAAPAGEKK
jgi:hypothetical protein